MLTLHQFEHIEAAGVQRTLMRGVAGSIRAAAEFSKIFACGYTVPPLSKKRHGMLESIFIIFMFQLVGEATQKYFALPIPGPVIGLVVMLACLLWTKRSNRPFVADRRDRLVDTSQYLLGYLSLLFVPIGVGVIMHLQLLEAQLAKIIGVVIIGTIVTMVFTAFVFLKVGGGVKDE